MEVIKLAGGEEVGIEWLKNEPSKHHVARFDFILDGIHARPWQWFEGDVDLHFMAVADQLNGDLVPGKFAFDDFVEVDVFAIDGDHASAIDGALIHGGDDVAGEDQSIA